MFYRWGMLRSLIPVPLLLFATAVLADGGPVAGCAAGSENQGFYVRLRDSYESHLAWNGADPSAPAATVVGGAEVPESNPPWPYSTWNIGGTPTIGVEEMYYNALMDALY